MSEEEREVEAKHKVRVHIDEHCYESPNPTTGKALYELGRVLSGRELYREVTGDREDPPIENDSEVTHLKEDEHFHSGPLQALTIIVNGRKREVSTRTLSFDQIVALAFSPVPVGLTVLFTITYRRGPLENPEGTLTEGASVKVRKGMIFDVTETNRS